MRFLGREPADTLLQFARVDESTTAEMEGPTGRGSRQGTADMTKQAWDDYEDFQRVS